jgi:NAD(P)-dependent dehydrogenase (short-subunit alcohol dehydrogenase family)
VEKFVDQMAQARGVNESVIEKEFFATIRPSSLIKRFAATDEVATLVTFIASPLASAVNGASLRVEGGVLRSVV